MFFSQNDRETLSTIHEYIECMDESFDDVGDHVHLIYNMLNQLCRNITDIKTNTDEIVKKIIEQKQINSIPSEVLKPTIHVATKLKSKKK